AGQQVFLEVQLPAAQSDAQPCRLAVAAVAHLTRGSSPGLSPEAAAAPADTACFKDASCVTASDFPLIDSATHSVAVLEFQDGAAFFLCSGGLIGAIGNASTPYLLTANHCFNTQASATSLEAWWNFKTASCGQAFPNENTFPATLGATLLATGTTSDFTFIRLSQNPPAGAFLLGWTTQDVSAIDGLKIYRLSHPAPSGAAYPEHATRQIIQGSPAGACSGAPQGNFIYSTQDLGGTSVGSSGSPVYLADGSIVGQLYGKCGSNTSNPCDSANNYLLDGAFRQTYSSVAAWLNPQGSGPCTASATALCLSGGRFRVTAAWQTATASGDGMGVQQTPDTGYFWFFNNANVEMVVKVLNGCSTNNRYWVFAGGLTNVRVAVSVTDTQNGNVRTYVNPINVPFQPIQDTAAFATCP
ncbi:MAG TPA: trypsin-like peptidase domain-containing protein, partial [Thermoanaerobaculia bacterium]|nr:trypsin-like peptidase domain-containing protein [Thermoanaerobaculia bacterium]